MSYLFFSFLFFSFLFFSFLFFSFLFFSFLFFSFLFFSFLFFSFLFFSFLFFSFLFFSFLFFSFLFFSFLFFSFLFFSFLFFSFLFFSFLFFSFLFFSFLFFSFLFFSFLFFSFLFFSFLSLGLTFTLARVRVSSTYRWTKLATHRHKGPHLVCAHFGRVPNACASSPRDCAVSIGSHTSGSTASFVSQRSRLKTTIQKSGDSFLMRHSCQLLMLQIVFPFHRAPLAQKTSEVNFSCSRCVTNKKIIRRFIVLSTIVIPDAIVRPLRKRIYPETATLAFVETPMPRNSLSFRSISGQHGSVQNVQTAVRGAGDGAQLTSMNWRGRGTDRGNATESPPSVKLELGTPCGGPREANFKRE